ncbi:MAG TPA: class III extradiol dioxygenase subunit B-like domain-containing protein [Micromonosporaceae bacterium]
MVAAAVCPHPPVLVPELAGRAAAELDDLRAACRTAIARLLAAEPTTVLVLAAGPRDEEFESGTTDTFSRFGVPLAVRLGRASGPVDVRPLPLGLLVGGWLLDRTGVARVVGRSVAQTASVADCVALGHRIAQHPGRIGLLVMGDGSACRGEKSPGYHDPRAEAYDDRVAAALARADSGQLLDLDPALSAELQAAGRVAWQVLAAAARAGGRPWRGNLSYYAAPYGVAYFVATWEATS